jgi:ribosomal protein L44E
MFIPITDKEDLFKKLREHLDDEVVIHYNCTDCDDEQVTYNHEPQDIINEFEEKGELYTHYDCTSCGYTEKFISIEKIQGFEIV